MVRYCSTQSETLFEYARAFMTFQTESEWAKRGGGPAVVGDLAPPRYDFVTGNPYEMPMQTMAESVARASLPKHKDWFAYTMNDPTARTAVAGSLSQRLEQEVRPEDLHLTSGGFAALAVAMKAVADPGDEIIVLTPCFFFYESLIAGAGAVPVRVAALRPSFEPDFAALELARGITICAQTTSSTTSSCQRRRST
jgi:aspartate aminotransferase